MGLGLHGMTEGSSVYQSKSLKELCLPASQSMPDPLLVTQVFLLVMIFQEAPMMAIIPQCWVAASASPSFFVFACFTSHLLCRMALFVLFAALISRAASHKVGHGSSLSVDRASTSDRPLASGSRFLAIRSSPTQPSGCLGFSGQEGPKKRLTHRLFRNLRLQG